MLNRPFRGFPSDGFDHGLDAGSDHLDDLLLEFRSARDHRQGFFAPLADLGFDLLEQFVAIDLQATGDIALRNAFADLAGGLFGHGPRAFLRGGARRAFGGAAVSYTHLDVYKRQARIRGRAGC